RVQAPVATSDQYRSDLLAHYALPRFAPLRFSWHAPAPTLTPTLSRLSWSSPGTQADPNAAARKRTPCTAGFASTDAAVHLPAGLARMMRMIRYVIGTTTMGAPNRPAPRPERPKDPAERRPLPKPSWPERAAEILRRIFFPEPRPEPVPVMVPVPGRRG